MTSNEENLALMESLFDKEMAPIVQSLEMVSAQYDVVKHRKLKSKISPKKILL